MGYTWTVLEMYRCVRAWGVETYRYHRTIYKDRETYGGGTSQ